MENINLGVLNLIDDILIAEGNKKSEIVAKYKNYRVTEIFLEIAPIFEDVNTNIFKSTVPLFYDIFKIDLNIDACNKINLLKIKSILEKYFSFIISDWYCLGDEEAKQLWEIEKSKPDEYVYKWEWNREFIILQKTFYDENFSLIKKTIDILKKFKESEFLIFQEENLPHKIKIFGEYDSIYIAGPKVNVINAISIFNNELKPKIKSLKEICLLYIAKNSENYKEDINILPTDLINELNIKVSKWDTLYQDEKLKDNEMKKILDELNAFHVTLNDSNEPLILE